MCSRHVRTLTRAAPSGSAMIALASGRSTRNSGRCGIETPNVGDRRRLADDRLERQARGDPPVVAAVEQADVLDAGVAQDQCGARRRDLAGPSARPLLVGVADRVAAVDDDRRVVR